MKAIQVSEEQFFKMADKVQFQNADIKEAIDFGYENVQDAFRNQDLPWARYWVIKKRREVMAMILEQRDGVISMFTTTKLPGSNLIAFIHALRKLVIQVTRCCTVVFVRVASWHKPGITVLRLVGFHPYEITNHSQIWIYEYGK